MVYMSRNPVDIISYHAIEGNKVDHRKRKRNRIRASCLNCYASKRKCDKKRPCTRCVRLGNTAFCVYETDEPRASDYTQIDEIKQLRHRIVELEGIVRHGEVKEPFLRRLSRNESYSDHSVHFRPKSRSKNTTLELVALNDISPKSESDVYDLNPAFTQCNAINSNHFSPKSDSDHTGSSAMDYAAGVGSYYHPSSPSACSSCNEIVTEFRALSTKTSQERETGYSSGYSSHLSPTSTHSHTIENDNHHPSSYQSPSPAVTECNCHCLEDPLSLAPLLNLGFALRTSLDVMERIHSHGSYCGLFSHISHLESHIFSLQPSQRSLDSPVHPAFVSTQPSHIDSAMTCV